MSGLTPLPVKRKVGNIVQASDTIVLPSPFDRVMESDREGRPGKAPAGAR